MTGLLAGTATSPDRTALLAVGSEGSRPSRCWVLEISCKVLVLSFLGPRVLGCFKKVHGIRTVMQPSHGERPEHLIFRILQPSQARFVILRPVPVISGHVYCKAVRPI